MIQFRKIIIKILKQKSIVAAETQKVIPEADLAKAKKITIAPIEIAKTETDKIDIKTKTNPKNTKKTTIY